ncbi:hypothetical protein [Streptomyces sp. NPDC049040]|uniref:hypothetical protein n=1 Tax=Streptomyces sp. NPDC049040 TaxID=3365593 RepID=UPI0037213567
MASRAAGEELDRAPGAALVPRATRTNASVSVRKNTARLRLALEVGYPADLGAVSAAVRRHVTGRIEAMTGMAVPEVVVEIEQPHSETARKGKDRVR